jgi:hypothetical protein
VGGAHNNSVAVAIGHKPNKAAITYGANKADNYKTKIILYLWRKAIKFAKL